MATITQVKQSKKYITEAAADIELAAADLKDYGVVSDEELAMVMEAVGLLNAWSAMVLTNRELDRMVFNKIITD